MKLVYYYFLILNLLAFILIALDKFLAKTQKRRISEQTLLGSVLLGGTIGSALAMLLFRHKTVKSSYLWKFWIIVLFQVALLLALAYNRFISPVQ